MFSGTESKADEKNNKDVHIDKDASIDTALSATAEKKDVNAQETGTFYERTFITFENEQSFLDVFKKPTQQRPPLKPLCAITR